MSKRKKSFKKLGFSYSKNRANFGAFLIVISSNIKILFMKWDQAASMDTHCFEID